MYKTGGTSEYLLNGWQESTTLACFVKIKIAAMVYLNYSR